MESTEEHILVEAEKLFMKFGMRSVTMDDIAKHLGMSKKTIYAHFRDKNDLVKSLITKMLKNDECNMQECMNHSSNAIEEVFLMMNFLKEMLSNINPIVFYDLEKYHNEAYKMMMEFHQNRVYHSVKINLERGIAENIFRPEINTEILAHARVGQINWIFESELIKSGKFSMYDVMYELTMQFLHGICTLGGHVLINNYTNQNNQTIK
ncbi:MAG: TetR/AcrR family transcriptional regulator [Sphingobacteriales bacterium]|nr:TetR/AcrR family transcriptional regulator [Sphingobacteriales bacterium]